MKSFLFYLICCVTVFTISPVMALRPGDVTAKVDYKLKWLDSIPFELGKLTPEQGKKVPQLRALVFFRSRAKSNNILIPLLESTRRNASGDLLIAAITPDSIAETKLLQKKFPEARVRFVVDTQRRLTPLFMGGVNLFPMAFLLDRDGKIIWRGEAVDLPEAVSAAQGGRLSKPAVQRLITLHLDEMFQRMKTAELRPLRITADKIFNLDPGNATAMRLLLFVLEEAGDTEGAWELCASQLAKAPANSRLYITALGVIKRHPELRRHLVPSINKLKENAATPEELFAVTNFLLTNYFSDAEAMEQAGSLLHSKGLSAEDLTAKQLKNFYSLYAYYCYLTGDLPKAIANQEKLLKHLENKRIYPSELATFKERLDFYRKLLQLQKKKW